MQTKPVSLSYKLLKDGGNDTSSTIESALGTKPGCLGIILIEDLPEEFLTLRIKLFHLAHRLANLPIDVREQLSRPATKYLFGWSHGKEVMNGRPDTQKGSFYANPLLDRPDVSEEKRAQHPEYYTGNVWPSDIPGLEEFESTFKALGRLIYDVGLALALACEPFVSQATTSRTGRTIEDVIRSSQCNKARLLHYYPEAPSSAADDIHHDALCGTHLDHSLLTGLCSAMYLAPIPASNLGLSPFDSEDGANSDLVEVPAPSPVNGLYIYPRHLPGSPRPEAVKVSIPPNCLAFQTGEALELLTAGKLAATPHFVSGNRNSTDTAQGSSGGGSVDSGKPSMTSQLEGVSRETFAFFLQPDVDEVIGPDGETFGQFTKRVLGRHYGAEMEAEG